jgi:hypothetical protein
LFADRSVVAREFGEAGAAAFLFVPSFAKTASSLLDDLHHITVGLKRR